MNAVTGVLQDLVRRRLWPIAVLLILAAVAVPVLLGRDPETVATPTAPGTTAAGVPIASLVDDFGTNARRRVLGVPKDPFAPSGRQPRPVSDDPTAPSTDPTADGVDPSGASGTSTGPGATGGASPGGSPGGGTGGSVPPAPVAPPVPTEPGDEVDAEAFELYALKIRYDEGEPQIVKRLAPLPDAEDPRIIYLGLLEDGKTAVFLLDAGVTTEGDGSCNPSPEDCQRVHLKKGETQFFDFSAPAEGEAQAGPDPSGEHQLEIVDIRTKRTTPER